jgi:hypothetical protein
MRELSSKRWIVAKGVMFLALAAMAATLLFLEAPSFRVTLLIALLAWASCRFYYFLFYVLQHYVDPELRYAGLIALLGQVSRTRSAR